MLAVSSILLVKGWPKTALNKKQKWALPITQVVMR